MVTFIDLGTEKTACEHMNLRYQIKDPVISIGELERLLELHRDNLLCEEVYQPWCSKKDEMCTKATCTRNLTSPDIMLRHAGEIMNCPYR
jgi:hypothetical protein